MDISKEEIIKFVVKRLSWPKLNYSTFTLDDSNVDEEMA